MLLAKSTLNIVNCTQYQTITKPVSYMELYKKNVHIYFFKQGQTDHITAIDRKDNTYKYTEYRITDKPNHLCIHQWCVAKVSRTILWSPFCFSVFLYMIYITKKGMTFVSRKSLYINILVLDYSMTRLHIDFS